MRYLKCWSSLDCLLLYIVSAKDYDKEDSTIHDKRVSLVVSGKTVVLPHVRHIHKWLIQTVYTF